MADDGMKTCPDCAERVQEAANVCRYCGHKFTQTDGGSGEANGRRDSDRAFIVWGFITALLFAPVGVYFGIRLLVRERLGPGFAVILVAVAVWGAGIAIIASSGGGSSSAVTTATPVPTVTTSASPESSGAGTPGSVAAAASTLATTCTSVINGGGPSTAVAGEVPGEVEALIAAYEQSEKTSSDKQYLTVAEENLKQGCGPNFAAKVQAALAK